MLHQKLVFCFKKKKKIQFFQTIIFIVKSSKNFLKAQKVFQIFLIKTFLKIFNILINLFLIPKMDTLKNIFQKNFILVFKIYLINFIVNNIFKMV